jgi:hypothetical protein
VCYVADNSWLIHFSDTLQRTDALTRRQRTAGNLTIAATTVINADTNDACCALHTNTILKKLMVRGTHPDSIEVN